MALENIILGRLAITFGLISKLGLGAAGQNATAELDRRQGEISVRVESRARQHLGLRHRQGWEDLDSACTLESGTIRTASWVQQNSSLSSPLSFFL
jgi:hypothetical protein